MGQEPNPADTAFQDANGETPDSEQYLWGIDLGGTKIEGIVFNRQSPLKPICRHRVPTVPPNEEKNYKTTLNQIHGLVNQLTTVSGITPNRIGIGTPGTLDPKTGNIRGSNSEQLNGKPLDQDLSSTLGIPVNIENDANCFALAEARLGAASGQNVNSVFGIIMGTGVGGGLVIGGKLISGRNAIAGEWGHNFLNVDGGPCYCGRIGCVETVISGPALERYYCQLTNSPIFLKDIVKRADNGESNAKQTIDYLCENFGKAVAGLVNIIDPDIIVVGGGVGNIQSLYTQGVDEIKRHIFAPSLETQIIPPQLGDSAGVYGAAYLPDQ